MLSVGFDGGMLSSDEGVLQLRGVEHRLGLADRLSDCLSDRRDAARIEHGIGEILRPRRPPSRLRSDLVFGEHRYCSSVEARM